MNHAGGTLHHRPSRWIRPVSPRLAQLRDQAPRGSKLAPERRGERVLAQDVSFLMEALLFVGMPEAQELLLEQALAEGAETAALFLVEPSTRHVVANLSRGGRAQTEASLACVEHVIHTRDPQVDDLDADTEILFLPVGPFVLEGPPNAVLAVWLTGPMRNPGRPLLRAGPGLLHDLGHRGTSRRRDPQHHPRHQRHPGRYPGVRVSLAQRVRAGSARHGGRDDLRARTRRQHDPKRPR